MAIQNDQRGETRPPTIDDLVGLCKSLNAAGRKIPFIFTSPAIFLFPVLLLDAAILL